MNQHSFHMPSNEELNTLMHEARQMRATALQAIFRSVGRATLRALRVAASALAGIATACVEGHRARLVYAELSRLSDRELAGLGLTRSDIASVSAGVYRDPADKAKLVSLTGAEPAKVTPLKPAAPIASQDRKAA